MTHVVYLSSNIITGCEECQQATGIRDDIGAKINHYLGHGYVLLHVGSETVHGQDGKPWHTTVAIMGHK